ncbi:MAG: response regulator [Vicinamibacterales bacterium]
MLTITTVHGPHARPSEALPDSPTVFIVHDDASVRHALESCIEAAGWEARTFGSANEFLDWPRPVVPSCLILDVALPDLNGLTLQRRVAAVRRRCRSSSSPRAATCRPPSRP